MTVAILAPVEIHLQGQQLPSNILGGIVTSIGNMSTMPSPVISDNKEIVLITGANVGLGLEIARKLLSDHGGRFYCLIGCRTPSKGQAAVEELHSQGLQGCDVIEIEVTDNDSIAKAAKKVEQEFGRLDVLHVNVSQASEIEIHSVPLFCADHVSGRHSPRQNNGAGRRTNLEDHHGSNEHERSRRCSDG